MSSSEADLLRVSAGAGLDEIKKAYRKAALVHHPDHNPDPQAARHFRRLTEAYRILAEEAQRREPVRPKRRPTATQRMEFELSDLQSLVRRWPAPRWTQVVDGLPATVWVAGALEVLARAWPGAPEPEPVAPTLEAIVHALEGWPARMEGWPLPSPLPRPLARSLSTVLDAAERRLQALDRPARRPSK